MFSAGVGTASQQPELANALIESLMTPVAVALLKIHGLEPVVR
jgi:hypothetical protein